MRILVACEFSGLVRDAFRRMGHDAWSCDLLPSEVEGPHIQDSVLNHLSATWNLLIAFPPCTHLCVSGSRWFERKRNKQAEALEFVQTLLNAPIPYIVLENPVGVISTRIRKPDQIIQPWMFGHGETKATCLWLKGLPKLRPTNIVDGREARVHRMAPGPNRSRERSRTYSGIAEAMADQWSDFIMQAQQANYNRWNTTLGVGVRRTGGGKFFRIKEGENLIRVMPFQHKVTKGDIELGRYSANVEPGMVMEEFFLPTRKHLRKGQKPQTCGRVYGVDGTFQGSCVICDQADDLMASALEADRNAAQRVKPSVQYTMNIVDLSNNEQQIMVWDAPYTVLGFILQSKDSTAYKGQELLGLNGRDLLVTYNQQASPRDKYRALWLDRDQAKKISAKGEVVDLYGDPSYVPAQFQGLITSTPQNGSGSPTTAPAASAAPKAAQTPPKAAAAPKPSPKAVEVQEEIPVEQPKRGPGRPKKKVEPTVLEKPSYKVGDTVSFMDGDEKVTGEITGQEPDGSMWNVVAGDTEYGVAEEEFIK